MRMRVLSTEKTLTGVFSYMFEALFACPGTFSPTVCFPSHIVALGLFASECESTGSAYATLRTPNFSRCLAASPLQSYFPLLLILQV